MTETAIAPTMRSASAARPMLIDELMPRFDANRVDHRVIDGSPEAVFEAVREADFVRTWKEKRAVGMLFAARTSAERLAARVRGREFDDDAEPPSARLADMATHGEWILLGEDAPHELAFGVIGRFWGGETSWRESDASEFPGFDEPGWARIACNFSLRPYGSERTLVSYESRTQATDPESRRDFLRYWRLVSPMVGVVCRAQLATVAEAAGSAR